MTIVNPKAAIAFAVTAALIVTAAAIFASNASALNFAKSAVRHDQAPDMKAWLRNVTASDFQDPESRAGFMGMLQTSLDEDTLTFSSIQNPETGITGLIVVYVKGVPKMWISDAAMIEAFESMQLPPVSAEKGLVPTKKNAKPFYTNSTGNPVTVSMKKNETIRVTFWVTPTGKEGNYTFFAYAKDVSGILSEARTGNFMVTIKPGKNDKENRKTGGELPLPDNASIAAEGI
jgi:hypothetical protein